MSASDLEPPLKRPRPSAPPPARGGDAGALGASFESSGGSVSVRRLLLDLARGVGRADFAAHRAAELAAAEENMGLSAAERAAERAGLVAPAALALAAEVDAGSAQRYRAHWARLRARVASDHRSDYAQAQSTLEHGRAVYAASVDVIHAAAAAPGTHVARSAR